jgi:Zn-dependent M28 family amino/carboxypeptidase
MFRWTILAGAALISPLGAAAQQQPPAGDSRLAEILQSVSAARIEADIRKLVSFGTRHSRSDTLSPARGIGAARRWIRSHFDSVSAGCGGCLEVHYVAELVSGLQRVPTPTSIVSVVAMQRGATDPDRVLIISGHYDSRVSDALNAVDSAPGANDDGSGTAAVLEAARVLSRYRFNATVVYAALAGEEQGLLGGQAVARWVQARNWRVAGVLNNDIIGNTRGVDGVSDNRTVRVFSEGTPPTETDAERRARRATGGEVDGVSRQLARYVKAIADRHVPAVDVWLIYRLDRYGRGGDHRAFADLGYPAVRITEAHEDYTRQHQDIRVENGIAYGDVADAVDFAYTARITGLNAVTLASLAWAPGPPRNVRVTGGGRPAAVLTWEPPRDSANVAGYRVYWRRTDRSTWDHSEWAGRGNRHTFTGRVIDNYFFGVAAVGCGRERERGGLPFAAADRGRWRQGVTARAWRRRLLRPVRDDGAEQE